MNDLETHVLQLIGEDTSSPDVFTETGTQFAQIRGSINDAIQEICMLSGSYTRTYHLVLREDRQFYRVSALQDHFAYVTDCWDRENQKRLSQIDLQTMVDRDPWFMKRAGSRPEFYGQCGTDHLFVAPYPTEDGTVLEVRYVAIPKAYTDDTDQIHVREAFRNATVFLAVSEYYASRGDAKRGTEYLTKYLEGAGLMGLHPETADRQFMMGAHPWPTQWRGTHP